MHVDSQSEIGTWKKFMVKQRQDELDEGSIGGRLKAYQGLETGARRFYIEIYTVKKKDRFKVLASIGGKE